MPDRSDPAAVRSVPRHRTGWRDQLRHSRPTRLLVGGGAAAIALVLIVTTLLIVAVRGWEIRDAERELSTLNVSLAEQTARALQSVDLILQSLVAEMQADQVATAADYERKNDRQTYELLKSKIAGVPQLDAVTLIAADGHLINFSRFFPIPAVEVADRDYFAALRNNPEAGSFLSIPVENRATGIWTVYLGRRVNGPDGQFVGIVLGAVNLAYFENLYEALKLSSGRAVRLWRNDGTLLARYPAVAEPGTFAPMTRTRRAIGEGRPIIAVQAPDLTPRLLSARAIRGYPVVVTIYSTMTEVLANWRRQALAIGIAGAIGIAAVVLFVWALIRQFGAYETLTRLRRQREEAVRGRETAEAQINQLQKMEALGQLTGGIAHDFNNILTVILGNADHLRRRLPAHDRELQALVDAMIRNGERGATLTHRLLAFARRQPLEPQPLDPNVLVAGMSDLLLRTLGEAITIETVLAADAWWVAADANQLENALLNLAVNARDAMPDGGRLTIATANATIDADAAHQGEIDAGPYVVISVADTGTGMTKPTMEKVFEPFFTTKEVGRGTGLGLSQVYGFVKQSGGYVQLDSEVGRGTTVRLYLPRAIAEAPPDAAVPPESQAAISVAQTGKASSSSSGSP